MKTFAAALLALTTYGSQIEASAELTTGATAEIESVLLGGHGLGHGLGRGLHGYGHGLGHYGTDSYSDSYSHSDFFTSDYSSHDYGFGYRRHHGAYRHFRYAPRYHHGRYYYGRRYASNAGIYHGVYRSYGHRSYGYGFRGNLAGYGRRYGGHYYGTHRGLLGGHHY